MNSESALKARKGRSPFSAEEREVFGTLLLERQNEVLKSLGGLADAGLRTSEAASGGSSSLPGHIAELASDAFEQELSLDFMARAQEELRDIQDALERLEHASFGICNECGGPIPKARLEAIPTAECCIPCQSQLEGG